jgi:hypothetical protein
MTFSDLRFEIPLENLLKIQGATISKVGVLGYRGPDGALDRSDSGLLELTLVNGVSMHVTTNGTGEYLQLFSGRWIDPFASEQSAETAEWVKEHGRWEVVDLSGDDGWQDLLSSAVDAVKLDNANSTTATLVVISAGGRQIKAQVGFDELLVTLEPLPPY